MQSLATLYRPKYFEDVCGQTSIIKILTRQLEKEDFSNCFLFCGASGCGKTTIARIFANGINKGQGAPIEIDGASNNGVDNIKQIISSAQERSVNSEYKVYIIDECHALTNQSWQALLKCIEEPPKYTIFIFCTTDPQKIPATILNRVIRFNFNRISADVVKQRLLFIAKNEKFTNYEDACDYISRICNGGMRDAISLLEKCANYDTDLNLNNVLEALGNYSYDTYFDLINNIIDDNEDKVLTIINNLFNNGNDLKHFIDQFLSFTLDISKYIITNDIYLTKIPNNYIDKLKNSINISDSRNYYFYVIDKLLNLKNMIKNDVDSKSTIEVYLLGMCKCK